MSIFVVGSSRNLFPEMDDGREKFLIDVKHDGDNIDHLNPWYCELTGLYYMWKNSNDPIIGLEHYRRFFATKLDENRCTRMSKPEYTEILKNYDIIVTEYSHGPKYTAFQWFKDSGFEAHLSKFVTAANQYAQGLGNEFMDYIAKRHTLIQCNMFIANKPIIDKYCQWIFDLLKIYDDIEKPSDSNKRMDGYFAEHIFGLYLEHFNINMYKTPKVEMSYAIRNGIPMH